MPLKIPKNAIRMTIASSPSNKGKESSSTPMINAKTPFTTSSPLLPSPFGSERPPTILNIPVTTSQTMINHSINTVLIPGQNRMSSPNMIPHTPSRIHNPRRHLSAFIDAASAKMPHTNTNTPMTIIIETTAGGQNKIIKPIIRAITPSTVKAHDSCAKILRSIPFISFIFFPPHLELLLAVPYRKYCMQNPDAQTHTLISTLFCKSLIAVTTDPNTILSLFCALPPFYRSL